jgi:hypothetical protein
VVVVVVELVASFLKIDGAFDDFHAPKLSERARFTSPPFQQASEPFLHQRNSTVQPLVPSFDGISPFASSHQCARSIFVNFQGLEALLKPYDRLAHVLLKEFDSIRS